MKTGTKSRYKYFTLYDLDYNYIAEFEEIKDLAKYLNRKADYVYSLLTRYSQKKFSTIRSNGKGYKLVLTLRNGDVISSD